MNIRYRVSVDDDKPGPPRTWLHMLRAVRNRAKRFGGPHQLLWPWSKPAEWGPKTGRPLMLTRLAKGLSGARFKTGETVIILCGKPGNHTRIRVTKVTVGLSEATPSWLTDVNSRVARVCRVAYAFDNGVRTNGLRVTRRVAGSSLWSQHSGWRVDNCLGNAADLVFPLPFPAGSDMARGDKLVAYLVDAAKRGDLPELGRLIWRDRYYERATNFSPQPYRGIYHTHIHVEGNPYRTGSVC